MNVLFDCFVSHFGVKLRQVLEVDSSLMHNVFQLCSIGENNFLGRKLLGKDFDVLVN